MEIEALLAFPFLSAKDRIIDDIPSFEEAFSIEELRKFYQQKRQTTVHSMIAHNDLQDSFGEECINNSLQGHFSSESAPQGDKESFSGIFYPVKALQETSSTTGTNHNNSAHQSPNENSTQKSFLSNPTTQSQPETSSDDQDTPQQSQSNKALKDQFIVIRSPPKNEAKPKKRFNDKQIADIQRCHFNDQDVLSLPKYMRPMNKKLCSEKAKSAVWRTKAPSASFKSKNENELGLNSINCNQEEDFQRKETMILEFVKIEREKQEMNNQALAPNEQIEDEADRGVREESPKEEKDEGKKQKQKQNEKRNMSGLIVGRVFYGIKSVLNGKNSIEGELEYIKAKFSEEKFVISSTSKSKFLDFIKQFTAEKTAEGKKKSRKTYKWVRDNAQRGDPYYANLLRRCVDAFLSEKGRGAIDFWVRNAKTMKKTTKDCLSDEKEREEFMKTFKIEVWDQVFPSTV